MVEFSRESIHAEALFEYLQAFFGNLKVLFLVLGARGASGASRFC